MCARDPGCKIPDCRVSFRGDGGALDEWFELAFDREALLERPDDTPDRGDAGGVRTGLPVPHELTPQAWIEGQYCFQWEVARPPFWPQM